MLIYGNIVKSVWRAYFDYEVTETDTTYGIEFKCGMNVHKSGYTVQRSFTAKVNGTDQNELTATTEEKRYVGIYDKEIISDYYEFEKKPGGYSASINMVLSAGGIDTTSVITFTFDVPALDIFTLTFNGNGGINPPSPEVLHRGQLYKIPNYAPTRDDYSFVVWNTQPDGMGDAYSKGDYYLCDGDATLYAQWREDKPPVCEPTDITVTSAIKNFDAVTTTIHNPRVQQEGRTITSITLTVGEDADTVTEDFEGAELSVTPTSSGTMPVTVRITDSESTYTDYDMGDITVTDPHWARTVEYTTLPPEVDLEGNIVFNKVEFYNYSESAYEEIHLPFAYKKTLSGWGFDVVLSEDYVADATSENPESKIRVTYDHADTYERDYRKAFYNTTRNANYSTGLANTVFVSGCTSENFTSRVWWSEVNNPLYFPDTNFVEVGSNDTQVMGLTKVGDYLGAIKQSKTTDTAIYLLYPTSFDDETTYAVKQGVQGVGAIAKYSFNVLGDETLFLSPNGVMAIVPSEDEEHKVQNRSFYVDGKLLAEPKMSDAYSFVYHGMYYLAIGGSCYVIDGNQKGSYGNDRTNLVYECYYLENVPAKCFCKLNDELWFIDDNNLCRVKKETDLLPFNDSYDIESGDKNVPVKAEWSTVVDDDGSLHYLKTMQKKGNVVSILPCGSHTSAEVYVKKDSLEPMLVGEINGVVEEPSDIPNELHIRKKVKKYKRLQFILKNEKAEGFGVDSITKSYVLGNYAKK